MKRKLLFAAALAVGAVGFNANAQQKEDVTSQYLQNPSFELSAENTQLTGVQTSPGNAVLSMYGWTQDLNGEGYNNTDIVDNTTKGTNTSKSDAVAAADGSYHLFFRKSWNSSTTSDISFTSNTFNLPAGQYEITYSYILEESNDNDKNKSLGSYLTVKVSDEISNKVDATIGYTGTWKTSTIAFKLSEAKELSIAAILTPRGGVKTELHLDNFVINKVTVENPATQEDFTNLQNLIDKIENNLGFEAGEYAPYNVPVKALAEAKAMISSGADYPKEDVDALIAELNGYINTEEVNAVYWKTDYIEADKASDGYIHPLGWTNTGYNTRIMNSISTTDAAIATIGTAIMTKYDTTYGETEGYTMPLKANTVYSISFRYCGWGNTPTTNVVIKDGNGTAVTVTPGSFKPETSDGNTNADHWYDYTATFTTNEAGNYVLALNKKDSGQQQIAFANLVIKKAVIEINEEEGYDNAITGTANVTLNRTIKAGINTLVLPFSLTQDEVEATFGTGSKVYVVKSYADGNITFDVQEGIEANVPYLLEAAEAGTTYEFVGVALETGDAETTEGDVQMIGTYAPKTLTADDANTYVVSDDKLYLVDSSVSVKATRAYFVVNDANGVKAISMSFGGEATGITTVVDSEAKTGKVYDLNGREVKTPSRGIYIIDGKKVFLSK